jgi:hypothetical protein
LKREGRQLRNSLDPYNFLMNKNVPDEK